MKKWLALLLTLVLAIGSQSCASAGTGLRSFSNQYEGYEFMYPNGWTEVKVPGAADVVFHDIVHETENVSVVISNVPEGKTLQDLGTPTEMGYKLSKSITAIAGDQDVELVSAQEISAGDKTYYILEYVADLPSGVRHNLASVIVRRGRLFTFNASTQENRWERVKDLMKQSVASFKVA
ncbi:photosystem II reaction center PsbP [Pseudanabaena sp. FACHB-2040]|uniref:photosystem II reaction center PsbP n=1 Tax=Pseudanabaena sp. FACHB-2040 TaxID=2692859 RepID=UPI001688099B|nr:photosystem II reaction center PsbP [Pseudanabaena sp. FACHB-2040]MBD2260661.1 photosystem II reaction center PsbP family protein [Pseudanabaena sp. FACHB-2040]